MTDDKVSDIKAAKEKLMESAQKVFAKMYEGAGAAGAGPDMSGATGDAGASYQDVGGDDDVVDADYKEV